MSSECDWRCRGGRLLVRGAHDILPTETHWVASGMWLPDWYERPHQRPDPHADHPGGTTAEAGCAEFVHLDAVRYRLVLTFQLNVANK